jgi:hypothetical protein
MTDKVLRSLVENPMQRDPRPIQSAIQAKFLAALEKAGK